MYIPACSWQMPVHYKLKKPPKPIRLPLAILFSISGLIVKFIRLSHLNRKNHKGGDFIFSAGGDRAEQGVSIGGLGAGTIGRTYRGNFGRWQLYPGKRNNKTVFADQFHIRIKAPGGRQYCAVLSPDSPEKGLESWNWGMKGIHAEYYALYPRAWTVYKIPGINLDITCSQITPFLPDNYKESSFPCGVFLWELTNFEKEDIDISLMQTWENNDGTGMEKSGGHENRIVSISGKSRTVLGVKLTQKTAGTDKGPVSFFIGTEENKGVSVSLINRFDTGSDGNSVLEGFRADGRLTESTDGRPSLSGEAIGAAVCASFRIPAGKTASVPFVTAWDIPIVTFGSGRQWYRRYTKFFGKDGNNILKIALEAFENHREWEKSIAGFQKPVIENKIIPAWLKTALLNELYYLADGGTFWDNGEVRPETSLVKYDQDDIRHFSYLECFDYDMINTFDVHFYSSSALAVIFPGLQKSIIRDFADTILAEDAEMRPTVLDKNPVMRKPYGVCPHDLGSPQYDPYFKINHYDFHDSAYWKDLNSKFVIQAYYEIHRDPSDTAFLKTCWPAAEVSLKHLEQFDRDGDGIPENTGFPDQTYDIWIMKGLSSYCGGLWITANAAAAKMAGLINDKVKSRFYNERVVKAKEAFEKKLFNGKYYLFDTTPSNSNIIFADQLCGEFWARTLDLDEAMLNPAHVRSALKTIYEYNVRKFEKGKLGAVNGMLSNGRIDNRNIQSREVWTGTAYTLAALMLTEGMFKEAYETAFGIYNTTYNNGYAFRTPEAFDRHRNYRATQYMRPLAVWAMWNVLFNKRLKN